AVGHLCEAGEGVEGRAGDELVVRLGAVSHPRADGIRLPAAVLAGQPSPCQRTECQVSDRALLAQGQEFPLVPALEERVAVLDCVRSASGERFGQLASGEIADSISLDWAAGPW